MDDGAPFPGRAREGVRSEPVRRPQPTLRRGRWGGRRGASRRERDARTDNLGRSAGKGPIPRSPRWRWRRPAEWVGFPPRGCANPETQSVDPVTQDAVVEPVRDSDQPTPGTHGGLPKTTRWSHPLHPRPRLWGFLDGHGHRSVTEARSLLDSTHGSGQVPPGEASPLPQVLFRSLWKAVSK